MRENDKNSFFGNQVDVSLDAIHDFNQAAWSWKFVKISSFCSHANVEPRFGFSTQTLVSLRVFKLLDIVTLLL